MTVKIRIIGVLLLLCVQWMAAQDQTFTARAPAVVNAGQQFQYIIEGSERGDVTLPSLEDFQLLAGPFSSYSSHSQWINGKMTMKTVVTYTHVFRAQKAGTYTIPPTTIQVGRKSFKTNPVQVVVNAGNTPPPTPGQGDPGDVNPAPAVPSGEDQPVFLRIQPSKREVYVGEQLVSGLRVYTKVNTRPASTAKDIAYEGFYKKELDPDANAQRQDIGGEQYITQVIQRHVLIPQKSGDITIAPYESEWMVPQRAQRRSNRSIFDDFFDDPFFNGYQDVPVKLATRPVTLLVKPLPAGAPAGFGGAVGDFSMNATLSAEELTINEALSLKITIRGAGNLPLLEEPVVNLPPDHDLYDVTRTLHTSTAGNRISGSVVFEYPIIARHAGRYRIPPVVFSWFDPVSNSYRSAESEEFNFTVLKGDSEEPAGAVVVPGVVQESVDDLGRDIRDISRELPLFISRSHSVFGSPWYRWAYVATLLASLGILILIRLVARRNADLKLVRNRRASKSARTRLKQADRFRKAGDQDRFYEEIGKALWGYLSDKLDIEISALSKEGVNEILQAYEIELDIRNEVTRILDESEFSRFAPSSEKSDVDQIYHDASELIRNLENRL